MSGPIDSGPAGHGPEQSTEHDPAGRRHAQASRYPVVGMVALGLATLAVVTVGLAIGIAATGGFAIGTLLGYVAIGLSAAAVVLGVAAAIANRGRKRGIAAAVVGVLANPLVLLVTLRLLGGGY